jgi:hypothetical protein
MKKAYQKPSAEVVEFRFSERIAVSGCYWGGSDEYTHDFEGCKKYINPNPGGWVNQSGPI